MVGSRGGGGGGGGGQEVRIPPRKSQKYRIFSITGPDPLKIVKLPSQLSIFCHNRHASELHHLNGGSLAGRRLPANSGIWTIPPPSN